MPMKYTKYIFILTISITLQSCFVAKKYQRPDDVMTDRQYRNAMMSGDSGHISRVPWREIFSDSLLIQYISRGLANNLDIRIALTNIEAAQAYVKQGQAAYYPTFNLGGSYALSSPSLNSQNLSERIYANQFELSGDLAWEADIWGKIRSNERQYAPHICKQWQHSKP
jgi:outer membrane protein TolC